MATLTQDRIAQIENLTLDLLIEAYGSVSKIKSPVDLTLITEKYGLKVIVASFEDESISGMYVKKDKTIYVREDDSYVRQIFTAAHELGHYIMHNSKENEIYYRADQLLMDDQESLIEKEANCFAASILMPRPSIENVFFFFKKIEEISSIFKVSNSTAYYRLKNLGILQLA